MKKGITKLLTLVIMITCLTLTSIPKLNAASGSIKVTAGSTTAVIGSEVKVTVTLSSSTAFGSWTYTLNYDSSKLKYVSGSDLRVVGQTDSTSGNKTKSYTYTFKVLASGTSTVSVSAYDMASFKEVEHMTVSTTSVNIKGITQAELEASYSKNNYLSSLKIEGYNFNEEFNKETESYTVTVPSDVEKITLTGSVEDKTASVTGLGEFDVSEGENKFDVVVTAQNGSSKTYTVKVSVEDENPIEVTIDGLKYTVVKRSSTLTCPSTFEETTQMINGIEVPAFKSNITGFTLVGLKTTDGEPNLYIYNEEANTYTLYKEIKTEGILLYPTISQTTPDYYKRTTITINGEEVEAFQYDGIDDYYLVYGINIETGSEGFYQYDMINNTITRYNDQIIKELTEKNENFLMIIIVLGVETIVMVLVLLIMLVKRNKTPKVKKQSMKDFEKELDKPIEKKEKIKEEKNKEEKKEQNKKEEKENIEEKDKK